MRNELIRTYMPVATQIIVSMESRKHDTDFIQAYRNTGIDAPSNYLDENNKRLSNAEGIAATAYFLAEAMADRVLLGEERNTMTK